MSRRTTQPRAKRRTNEKLSLLVALGLAVLSLALLLEPSAWAEAPGYVLIAHPDTATSTIARDFAAQAFLKRATRWPGGETIRPVDLPAGSRTRREFSRDVLNRSVEAMRSYWQQRIFSGRDLPPPELANDEAVVRYVLGTKGAIGYVSVQAKLERSKVLVLH